MKYPNDKFSFLKLNRVWQRMGIGPPTCCCNRHGTSCGSSLKWVCGFQDVDPLSMIRGLSSVGYVCRSTVAWFLRFYRAAWNADAV